MSTKEKKHLVSHHNMFGTLCEIADVENENDFKIYCHREHKISIPECDGCKYFGGSEMGKGVCCIWEESYEAMSADEHVVHHDEMYLEYIRVEIPEWYKMISDGELDLCKVWQGLD